MYSSWQLALKYLQYYFSASNGKGHGIHSPYVFNFITQILNDRSDYSEYKIGEELRDQLLNDDRKITFEDFGAGSGISKTNERTVKEIAKHSAKSKKFAQLLFRMVRHYQPSTILELGTSLGITTTYLSLAKPGAKIITVEGAAEVAKIAEANFQQRGLANIRLEYGNFDSVLPGILKDLRVNFGFIDGNHQELATLGYLELLLPRMENDSILVFDDIHWSPGMENAWRKIRECPQVSCTVDLFFIGVVFFRQEFHEKQHFNIRV